MCVHLHYNIRAGLEIECITTNAQQGEREEEEEDGRRARVHEEY